MLDLLFLAHRLPYPPDKGDKIRSWHFLQHLALRFRVHLGCFFDDPADAQHEGFLNELCASVCCLPLSPLSGRLRALPSMLSGESLTRGYYRDRRLQAWVKATIEQSRPSRIFVFCSAMAGYVEEATRIRRIMDMVDVDSEKWRQYAETRHGAARLLWSHEARCLLQLERQAARNFDATVFVSAAEAEAFRRLVPESTNRIHTVNNGVDLDYFKREARFHNPFDGRTAIVFTGAMNYWPNIDGVRWFSTEVMPRLRRLQPSPVFWIVGADPSPAVEKLASATDIRITGRVEDVRPYLAHAKVVVAPLRIARGIQNKVLEAMAMGAPVVATPDAVKGLTVRDEAEVLTASSAEGFADQIVRVVTGACATIGNRGRARVERDYAWLPQLRKLDGIIEGGP
jgi:sugar transferase (PEP-CTERM/EpsH1 system associated)